MLRVIAVFTFASLVLIQSASAAIIRVAGGGSSPPSVIFDATTQPKTLTLEFFNDTGVSMNVSVWQLELSFATLSGANGELLIQSVGPAPNGLFDPVPGPFGIDNGGRFLAFDGDPLSESGREVPSGTSKNIAELAFTSSPDASGLFELRMHNFDPLNPVGGSSLLVAGDIVPMGFSNPPSAEPGQLLIGSILIRSTIPEPSSIALAASILAVIPIGRRFRVARAP
jgi:hypothetical protein